MMDSYTAAFEMNDLFSTDAESKEFVTLISKMIIESENARFFAVYENGKNMFNCSFAGRDHY